MRRIAMLKAKYMVARKNYLKAKRFYKKHKIGKHLRKARDEGFAWADRVENRFRK
jgi:hypothetical protein